MKKAAATLLALTIVLGGASAPATPIAPRLENALSAGSVAMSSGASPTGQYEWVCVLTTGNTYSMRDGEPLTNCKGSYLQKYLNGRQLAVYRLAYDGNGAIANVKAEGCLLAVAGGVLTILSPAWTLRYVASVAVGGIGVYASCKA